ncbi:MAG: VWA domain-containing protein, partial [bacterium]|nr:VWA domain-containing protein [Candidatus Kapabacteria bacterium]
MKHLVTLCTIAFLAIPHLCNATGALFVRPLNSQQTFTTMSIRTYDASVEIQDQIAVTHVDQTFYNALDSRVESTYIFPLTDGAVITSLVYWFNGKRYVANLRERKEAQQQYNEKVRRLIDPALLQYLGDNVFKLNIAPIDAKSEVRFEITYAELLPYDFGFVDYRFLLKTTGLSPEPLERVSLRINAQTGTSFKTFATPSHPLSTANQVVQLAPNRYSVNFGDENYVADRDYLVRFETKRDSVGMNALTYSPTPADSFGVDHFYALWITPPDSVTPDRLQHRDIVVTADISSSMEGERIEQLREALNAFLDALVDTDRFNLVTFGTGTMLFRPDLVEASHVNISAARRFVDEIGAIGLTNIDAALKESLRMSFGETTTNLLVFLTDGYPTWGETNLTAIVDSATARNGARVRIFPFGIGEELSRSLLETLAQRNG